MHIDPWAAPRGPPQGGRRGGTGPTTLSFVQVTDSLTSRRGPRGRDVGLMALLLINMSLAQGAYQLHDLQTRAAMLQEDEQQLREELAVLESPSHLAREARKIGMVPGTVPVFLDVSDRSLTGKPVPAPAPSGTTGGN